MLEVDILNLEKELLKPEVRSNPDRIIELVADNFTEHCSSGAVYKFNKGDISSGDDSNNWEIMDFSLTELLENVCLALYRVIKHNEINLNRKVSLRSSVWKKTEHK